MDDLSSSDTLSQIRDQIDIVDRAVFDLLVRRSQLIEDINTAKPLRGMLPIRPSREAQQLVQLIEWYRTATPLFSLEGLVGLWREMISSSVVQQGVVRVVSGRDQLGVVRGHFGSSLDYMIVEDSCARIGADDVVAGDIATLVSGDAGWAQLTGIKNLMVFARLSGFTASSSRAVFALGRVIAEASGVNDATLLRVPSSRDDIVGTRWEADQGFVLIECDGFLDVAAVRTYGDDVRWLGSYPRPILAMPSMARTRQSQ